MKTHPATQYKRKYNDIIIKDPALSTSQPIGVIGRRTGQLFVDDNETNIDFLLKEDLPLRPPTIGKEAEKYSSNSSSSASNSSLDDSSSEAEESGDEDEEVSKEIKQINIEEIKKSIIQAEEEMLPLQFEDEPKKETIPDVVIVNQIEKKPSPVRKSFRTKEEIEKERKEAQLRFEALSSIKKPNKNDISALDDNSLLLEELNKARKRTSITNTERSKGNDTIQLDDLSFVNKPTSLNSSDNEINSKEYQVVRDNKQQKKRNANKTIPEEEPEKEQESQEMLMNIINSTQSAKRFEKKNDLIKNKNKESELQKREKKTKKEEEMKSIDKSNKEMEKEKKKKEEEKKERKEKKRQDKLSKEKEEKKKKQDQITKEKEKKKKEDKLRQDQINREREEKKKLIQLAKEREEEEEEEEMNQKKNKVKNNKQIRNNKEKQNQSERSDDSDDEISLKDISIMKNESKDEDINQNQNLNLNKRSLNEIHEVSEQSIQIPTKNISLTKINSIIIEDDRIEDQQIHNASLNNIDIISNSDLPVEKVNVSQASLKEKIKEEKQPQSKLKKKDDNDESKDNILNNKHKVNLTKKITEKNEKDDKEEIDSGESDSNSDSNKVDSKKEKENTKKSKGSKGDNNKLIPKIFKEKPQKQKVSKLKDDQEEEEDESEEEETKVQPKKIKTKKKIVSQTEYEKITYSKLTESQPKEFEVIHSEKNQTFGLNGRYSLRMRIPRLNKLLGERVTYIRTEYGDEIQSIYSSRKAVKNITDQLEIGKPKKRKLRKGLKNQKSNSKRDYSISNSISEIEEDELNDSYSERDEDNSVKLLVIKPHSQKSLSRNYQTELIFRIRESSGKNSIIINNKEYRNLKKNSTVNVPPNCEYQIKNYSKTIFVVAICFLDNSDDDIN